jgi:copper transport protein
MRRRVTGALAALILLWGFFAAPAASAHATVVSTDPPDGTLLQTAPDHVSVVFNEAVELQFGALRVFASDGSRADDGSATHVGSQANTATVPLHSGLKNGTYTVSWRVISADSHPVHGAFTFSIGNTSTPDTAAVASSNGSQAVGDLYGVTRWIAYLGFALLVGSAALMIAFAPVLARDHRARRVLAGGWFVLLVGSVGALLLQGPYGAGFGLGRALDPGVVHATLRTRLGKALGWRLVLLGATGLVVSWIATQLPTAPVKTRRLMGAAGAVLATALAVTWSAADHSSVGKQVGLALPADVLHLLAMATWIGGLALLTVGVLWRDPVEISVAGRADIVKRFSPVAFSCVGVLAATGFYQGWRQVGTLSALTGTDYGRLLLIKAGCFAVLIALGAFARRKLAAADPDLKVLRLSVAAEFGIALFVLGVTALLVESQPAQATVSAPVSVSTAFDTGAPNGTGRGTVNLVVAPAKVGLDTVHVYILGENGQQESVPEVDVALELPSKQIGPLAVKLVTAGPGHYIGSDATIPFTGSWQVAVTVRTTAIDEATVVLPVQVR